MSIGMTLSAKQSTSANCRRYPLPYYAGYVHCDGRQLKLADSSLGQEQYRSSDYYVWPAGSYGQLLFIFPTRVSLTTITLHYYSDSVRGLPRLRFYAVRDNFNVWNTSNSIVGKPHVNVAAVSPPGGQQAGRRNVSINVKFYTKKLLMYNDSSSFQFALSEVEFFLCSQWNTYWHRSYWKAMAGVEGNGRGAPAGACVDLQPNQAAHREPQETTVPYGVNMSPFRNNSITGYVYTPERVYVLTFSSNTEGQQEESFRGLLIQSRLVADDTSPVGVFDLEDRRNSRRSFCSPRSIAITHRNRNPKSSISFRWTAPPLGTGPIRFRFAVVQERDVHWANQQSEIIQELGNVETFTSTQEPTASSTVTSTPTSPTTTESTTESATTDSEVSTTLPASTSEALVTPTVESTETTLDSTVATSTLESTTMGVGTTATTTSMPEGTAMISTLSESTTLGGTTATNANIEATTNGMPERMEMTSTPSESSTVGVGTTTSTDDEATTMEVSSATIPETTVNSASQVSTHQTITNGINTEDPIQVQTQGPPNVVTMAIAADDTATQPIAGPTHVLIQVLGCGCSSLQYF